MFDNLSKNIKVNSKQMQAYSSDDIERFAARLLIGKNTGDVLVCKSSDAMDIHMRLLLEQGLYTRLTRFDANFTVVELDLDDDDEVEWSEYNVDE